VGAHDDDLIPLDACAGLDPADVGRKASVLAWAQAQGLPTPGGVVLPASRVWAGLEACGTRAQAHYLAASALRLDPRHSMDLAADIFAALGLPAALDLARAHAETAFKRLGARRLVARSSSALEDGRTAAFPGVFLSRLDLTSADELAHAIVDCWRSVFSPVALQYLLRMRAEPIDFSLAVLIQPQIKADWYGLYVGADPVSGAPTPVAELTRQAPDALVNGSAAMVRARQVGDAWSLEPDEPALASALGCVSGLAARPAARVPGPLDIEFALSLAKSEPVLLQCRPITPARIATARMRDTIQHPLVVGRPCAPGTAAGLALPPDQLAPSDVPRIAVVEGLTTKDYDLVFRHRGIVAVDEVSPLSHVAILCRELGVPLVCGAGPEANGISGSWILLDGSSGVAELLSAPLEAAVDACAQEPVLYVADVERTLLLLVGCRPASARSAARPLEQELARELGAEEARILAVRLVSAEVEQLAAIAERSDP
jgi:Phosphoenolpyruvate synthase/pyruvate phosphate dikinase